jgi:cell division protease FtsH
VKFDEKAKSANAAGREPSKLLASAILQVALPNELRRKLTAQSMTLLLLVVPNSDWIAPLEAAARRRWPFLELLATRSAPTRWSAPQSDTPSFTGPVIVLTPNAAWLPPALVAAADHRLALKLTPKMVALAIRAFTKTPIEVTQADLCELDFQDVLFAMRPGATSDEIVGRLKRAVARRMQAGHVILSAPDTAPSLEQLPGYGDALVEVKAIAADIRRLRNGARTASAPSLLFYGPPGTGKTMLAAALARTLGAPLLKTTVADWFLGDGHLGSVVTNANRFFHNARAAEFCVAFLDEIDALPDRERMDERNRAWWTPVTTGILKMIDDTRAAGPGVVLVAATNQYENLDAALKRPGRFDRHVKIVGPESASDAIEILRFHLRIDLEMDDLQGAAELAAARKATGAEIENFVAIARGRADAERRSLVVADLIDAIAPPDTRDLAAQRRTAIHEAGHVVVAHALGLGVQSVSIVSEGQSLGRTSFDDGALVPNTRATIETHIMAGLAGRAADELITGAATANASFDLKVATRLSAALHGCFGLGDRIYARGEIDQAEMLLDFDLELRRLVEAELDRLMAQTRELVRRLTPEIKALADHLMARRIASPAEVAAIISGVTKTRRSPRSRVRP